MVKQPAMEASEFTMSNEDFPALPGVPGPGPNSAPAATSSPAPVSDGLGVGPPVPQGIVGTPLGMISHKKSLITIFGSQA